jgi:hypothetical protein
MFPDKTPPGANRTGCRETVNGARSKRRLCGGRLLSLRLKSARAETACRRQVALRLDIAQAVARSDSK